MNRFITITFLLAIFNYGFSQETEKVKPEFSITLSSGLSQVALKDETISLEKYSGSLTPISIVFNKEKENSSWRLYLKYSSGLPTNYNIKAEFNDLNIGWDYSYNLKSFQLFGDYPTYLFGGFSPNLLVYYRKQHIAEPGQFLHSAKLLFNMSGNVGVYGALTKKVSYNLTTHLNLFTYGIGLESEEGDLTMVSQASSGFSTPVFQSVVSLNYELVKGLKLGISYDFKYVKHDELSMSTDSFLISITKKIGK